MNRFAIILGMIFLSFPIFSQTNEIRDAERLLSKKNYTDAFQIITAVAPQVEAAPDEEKIRFHYVTALSAYGMILEGIEQDEVNENAIKSFNAVKEIEAKNRSRKFSDKIEPHVNILLSIWINQAIASNEQKQYLQASKQFQKAYELNKVDTVYLYYAAGAALNGKDFDMAESRYRELIRLKYNGKMTIYTAYNLSENKIESFGDDQKLRDAMIRRGSHSDPKTIEESDKKAEIYKNLGLILMQKKNYSEAEDILNVAYKQNPKDESILLAMMDLYDKTNRSDLYDKFAEEALHNMDENSFVPYNLGVKAFNDKKYETARTYFEKAVQIKDTSEKAYIMLAKITMIDDASITTKLNQLNTKPNSSQYKMLYKQKEELYHQALSYLKKAYELNNKNTEVASLIDDINHFLNQK